MELKHLKSGTDVRGTAVNPNAPSEIDLTDEAIKRITLGFIEFLEKEKSIKMQNLTISVGHDSRVSAERIKSAVISALSGTVNNIKDCELCSTPAMFMTTKMLGCDGAIMITASHHPWDRNGLKFFTKDGGLSGSDIAKILEIAENVEIKNPKSSNIEKVNFLESYSKLLSDMIKDGVKAENYDKPLAGLKIVVDAGNGVGGFYADKVLSPLGADTRGSRFLEPDGRFPNHIPNPENKEAMESIREATLESGADLGVIFDTDVDRGGCVSSDGKELNRNRLVALAAVIALENNENGWIVTDSVTSAGLTEFINDTLGGKHLRFKRGYKNVIDEAARLCKIGENAPLAIETSGHAAFRENYFLDDGAYLVTKIIIKMAQMKKNGKQLDDLIKELKEPKEEVEIRLKINENDFKSYGENVIKNLESYSEKNADWIIASDNHEGIKISFNSENTKGFFIFRLSVHDPIIPINIESAIDGGTKEIAKLLYEQIIEYKSLDLTTFLNFLQKN
ncbi:MAG: phosphomannomutase/phosphoglucomutase [Oscillospiraceae bacterium]